MLTLNRTVVSRAAKVNCTDVLIVLWAWHPVATPGRAKQAKVKSASLVRALLTTHPRGEAWGGCRALPEPTFSSPAAGWASAPTGQHPPMQHPPVPPAPALAAWPGAAGEGQQPSQVFWCTSLAVSKVWKFLGVSFSARDRVQISGGAVENQF